MSSITLSASIRANLLSLQNTTKLLDLTANRLSTGKRVNSAIDNPGSFFTARSLTNRATDLNARKDSIGQAISLLQATDKSITSLTSLVEQAKAKAQQADEAATGGINTVSTKKATTITGVTTISTAFGNGATAATTLLTDVGVTATEGVLITINTVAVTISQGGTAGLTIGTFAAAINARVGISASYNTTTNQIDITGNGGVDFVMAETGSNMLADIGGLRADGLSVANASTRTFASKNTTTDQIFEIFGATVAENLITTVTSGGTGTYAVSIGSTVQDLLTAINLADTALTATYNTTTSKIDIKAVEGVSFDLSGNGFTDYGWTTNEGNALITGTDIKYSKLGSATEVGALSKDFQSLLAQIDTLIGDSSYKGKNLLKGAATLSVKFNAKGDSKLTITGKTLETDTSGILSGLKFTQKATDYDFETAGDITAALADVNKAIDELRTISSTFGTHLGIIQTRESFTVELVNALEAGAGKLVNASLEEESANLLALQTRQALGIQSLAIANQSQQSILALFR